MHPISLDKSIKHKHETLGSEINSLQPVSPYETIYYIFFSGRLGQLLETRVLPKQMTPWEENRLRTKHSKQTAI